MTLSIEKRINSVVVTVEDLLATIKEIHGLPPEDCDWESRTFLMASLFSEEPDKAMAIDSRLIAMSEMIDAGHLPGWTLPKESDGSVIIAESVWKATAEQPLKCDAQKIYFDKDSFLERVLELAEVEGHA